MQSYLYLRFFELISSEIILIGQIHRPLPFESGFVGIDSVCHFQNKELLCKLHIFPPLQGSMDCFVLNEPGQPTN